MTDHFAALDQPRAAWLDPATLKEAFHRKTLLTHPDVAGSVPGDFASLNEAYQVLLDPKRRIQHLLTLENAAPLAQNQIVPEDLQELFMSMGGLNQRVTQLLEKAWAASNPLSRSLLKGELVAAQKEVAELREKIRELSGAAEERLRRTDPKQTADLSILYRRFAYLGRWSEQLDELAFQLSVL